MKYDVCVFGGCSIDQFYYKDENSNVPETPNLIVPGGKASNQAVAASRAGAKVALISKIGKDNVGQKILENLVYNNVATNNVEVVDDLQNDYAKIVIDEKSRDNNIERFTGTIDSFTPDMIEKYKKVFLNSKIVLGQTKVPKEVTIALINFCNDNNIPLIITPCRPQKLCVADEGNEELINKITYITANRKECETIFCTKDIESCVERYPNKLIVTLGDEGVMYHNGKEIVKVSSIDIKSIEDTTGAGDTFAGNLAASLIEGYSLYDAVVRGQYASSMKIQKRGAQDGMPYKDELEKYMMSYLLNDNDYMSEFDLAYSSIIEAAEAIKKKSIVKVKVKADSSFVTESDLLVEKMLIDNIVDKYPYDNFVTEEFNNENTIKNRTWVIDPIDGTAHYMKGSIFWGIQLAFVDNGETQFSIIYLPKLDEMYYAIKGEGSYMNHKKINIKNDVSYNRGIIEFSGSMLKCFNDKKELFEKFMNYNIKPANYMYINCSAIAFTNMLSSRTNTLVFSSVEAWDILPGVFMLEEAGFKNFKYKNLNIYSNVKYIENILFNKETDFK